MKQLELSIFYQVLQKYCRKKSEDYIYFKNKDTRYYSIFKEILKALSTLNTSILIYEVGSIQSNKRSVILLVSAICLDLQCLGYIK